MDREIKFQVIYANKIDGYERLVEKDGNIFWQWMCLEMNPNNLERWITGVYPKQFEYIRRQFTGLKDKNGKEIYEGDICKVNYYELGLVNGVVKFRVTYSGYYLEGKQFQESMFAWEPDYIEIIGNIYENPELLNQPPCKE